MSYCFPPFSFTDCMDRYIYILSMKWTGMFFFQYPDFVGFLSFLFLPVAFPAATVGDMGQDFGTINHVYH